MTEPRPAQHIRRDVPDSLVERQWAIIQLRRRSGWRHRRWGLFAFGAITATTLVAAALFLLPLQGPDDTPAISEYALFQATDRGHEIQLTEGSTVTLDNYTEVRVCRAQARDVCLAVDTGRARFDVVADPRRRFRVRAGEVEISVVGTRFTVERQLDSRTGQVRVSVQSGTVEVVAPGAPPHRLTTGQDWSVTWESNSPDTQTPSTPLRNENRPEVDADGPAVDPPESATGPPDNTDAPLPTQQERPDPSKLWERALQARRRGDHTPAKQALELLLKQFPKDPRAPLAAFELGRLCMDVFNDANGAIRAFNRVITQAPHSNFHEDAMARLVRVYAAGGKRLKCDRARKNYLKHYPDGLHVSSVKTLCEDL